MDEAVEAIIGGYSNIRALDYIEVFNGNRLVFHLKDKTEKVFIWTERSRSESWSDNMKQMARERSTELDKLKKRGDDGRWLRSE